MRSIVRFISALLVISFSITSTGADYAFALSANRAPSIEHLATPSRLDDISGLQVNRMTRVQHALETYLLKFSMGQSAISQFALSHEVGQQKLRVDSVFQYQFDGINFLFGGMAPVPDTDMVAVECKIKDKHGSETFHVIFALSRDKEQGFPVRVYTKNEVDINGLRKLAIERPERKKKDREALRRDMEGEKIIDEWIRKRMEAGLYSATGSTIGEKSGLYNSAMFQYSDSQATTYIMNAFWRMQAAGIGNELAVEVTRNMKSKRLIILPVDFKNGESLPRINMLGEDNKTLIEVDVTAHSSDNAIYIMVDREKFEAAAKTHIKPGEKISKGDKKFIDLESDNGELYKDVMEKILYEAGVHLGMLGVAGAGAKMHNALTDSYKESEKSKGSGKAYTPPEGFKDLKPVKSFAECSLDRDHAAGEVQKTDSEDPEKDPRFRIFMDKIIPQMEDGIRSGGLLIPEEGIVDGFHIVLSEEDIIAFGGSRGLYNFVKTLTYDRHTRFNDLIGIPEAKNLLEKHNYGQIEGAVRALIEATPLKTKAGTVSGSGKSGVDGAVSHEAQAKGIKALSDTALKALAEYGIRRGDILEVIENEKRPGSRAVIIAGQHLVLLSPEDKVELYENRPSSHVSRYETIKKDGREGRYAVRFSPDGRYFTFMTHGQGIWRVFDSLVTDDLNMPDIVPVIGKLRVDRFDFVKGEEGKDYLRVFHHEWDRLSNRKAYFTDYELPDTEEDSNKDTPRHERALKSATTAGIPVENAAEIERILNIYARIVGKDLEKVKDFFVIKFSEDYYDISNDDTSASLMRDDTAPEGWKVEIYNGRSPEDDYLGRGLLRELVEKYILGIHNLLDSVIGTKKNETKVSGTNESYKSIFYRIALRLYDISLDAIRFIEKRVLGIDIMLELVNEMSRKNEESARDTEERREYATRLLPEDAINALAEAGVSAGEILEVIEDKEWPGFRAVVTIEQKLVLLNPKNEVEIYENVPLFNVGNYEIITIDAVEDRFAVQFSPDGRYFAFITHGEAISHRSDFLVVDDLAAPGVVPAISKLGVDRFEFGEGSENSVTMRVFHHEKDILWRRHAYFTDYEIVGTHEIGEDGTKILGSKLDKSITTAGVRIKDKKEAERVLEIYARVLGTDFENVKGHTVIKLNDDNYDISGRNISACLIKDSTATGGWRIEVYNAGSPGAHKNKGGKGKRRRIKEEKPDKSRAAFMQDIGMMEPSGGVIGAMSERVKGDADASGDAAAERESVRARLTEEQALNKVKFEILKEFLEDGTKAYTYKPAEGGKAERLIVRGKDIEEDGITISDKAEMQLYKAALKDLAKEGLVNQERGLLGQEWTRYTINSKVTNDLLRKTIYSTIDNFRIKKGEKFLIIVDEKIKEFGEFIKTVADSMRPGENSLNTLYVIRGEYNSAELLNGRDDLKKLMEDSDVIFAPAGKSLTYNPLMVERTKALKLRYGTVPRTQNPAVFLLGSALENPDELCARTERWADVFRNTHEIRATNSFGTDITFTVTNKYGIVQDNGRYDTAGKWGNAGKTGETETKPTDVNGVLKGFVILEGEINYVEMTFENGELKTLDGSGPKIQWLKDEIERYPKLRIVAEIAKNLNTKGVLGDRTIECEKGINWWHFALGTDNGFGGTNVVEEGRHYDFVVLNTNLDFDGVRVIEEGKGYIPESESSLSQMAAKKSVYRLGVTDFNFLAKGFTVEEVRKKCLSAKISGNATITDEVCADMVRDGMLGKRVRLVQKGLMLERRDEYFITEKGVEEVASLGAKEFVAMKPYVTLGGMTTELPNPRTKTFSEVLAKDTAAGLSMLADVEDSVNRVFQDLPENKEFQRFVEEATERALKGHRIFLLGVGSSGRAGIDVEAKWREYWRNVKENEPAKWQEVVKKAPNIEDAVVYVMGGGSGAITRAVEKMEDGPKAVKYLKDQNFTKEDMLWLISASGSAPFNLYAGNYAVDELHSTNVRFLCCSEAESMTPASKALVKKIGERNVLRLIPGPQAITGSTRMEAGTITLLGAGAMMLAAAKNIKENVMGSQKTYLKELTARYPAVINEIKRVAGQKPRGLAAIAEMGADVLREGNFFNPTDSVPGKGHITFVTGRESGRATAIDGVELVPTFGVAKPLWPGEKGKTSEVWTVIGDRADQPFTNQEAWEALCGGKLRPDDEEFGMDKIDNIKIGGEEALARRNTGSGNLVVGVLMGSEVASFKGSFTEKALNEAKAKGSRTALIVIHDVKARGTLPKEVSDAGDACDAFVALDVQEDEFLLNQSAALKTALNMLSTATMGKLGAIYGNIMIGMHPSNNKLKNRIINIILGLSDAEKYFDQQGALTPAGLAVYERIANLLYRIFYRDAFAKSQGRTLPSVGKIAVEMERLGISYDDAVRILQDVKGDLTAALKYGEGSESGGVIGAMSEKIGGIIREQRDNHTVYTLTNNLAKTSISVVSTFGANMISVKRAGREMTKSPASIADLVTEPHSYGMPVLFPTPSIVDGDEFTFEGTKCKLKPNSKGKYIHGLVANKEWKVEATGSSDKEVFISLSLTATDYPDIIEQFPFPFKITLTYTLRQDGSVKVDSNIRNIGSKRFPFGFGLHPYFDAPNRNMSEITSPLGAMWDFSGIVEANVKNILRQPVPIGFDMRQGKALEDYDKTVILARDASVSGDVLGQIVNKGQGYGVRIIASPEFRYLVTFSPKGSGFAALEPWTSVPNGIHLLNAGNPNSGMRILTPGEEFNSSVVIEPFDLQSAGDVAVEGVMSKKVPMASRSSIDVSKITPRLIKRCLENITIIPEELASSNAVEIKGTGMKPTASVFGEREPQKLFIEINPNESIPQTLGVSAEDITGLIGRGIEYDADTGKIIFASPEGFPRVSAYMLSEMIGFEIGYVIRKADIISIRQSNERTFFERNPLSGDDWHPGYIDEISVTALQESYKIEKIVEEERERRMSGLATQLKSMAESVENLSENVIGAMSEKVPAGSNGLISVKALTVEAPDLSLLRSTGNDPQSVEEIDSKRVAIVKSLFKTVFGKPHAIITKAGGRDNVQGEHVDYPQEQIDKGVHLFSMGGAIQNNFLATLALRDDGIVRIAHANGTQVVEFKVADLEALQKIAIEERQRKVPANKRVIPVWANHTMGVIMQVIKTKKSFNGADILLTSNVDHGAGLSNSAANCIAVTMALNETLSLGLNTLEIVAFARDGEHDDFVGSTCGWLDQLLIMFSRKGYFSMIDYATKEIKQFESRLPVTLQRVLVNTNVPHDLAVTEYNDRNLKELPKAYETLRQIFPGREIKGSTSLTLGELNHLIKLFDPNAPSVDFADRQLLLDNGFITEQLLSEIDDISKLPPDSEILAKFDASGYKKPVMDSEGKRAIVLKRHRRLSERESFALLLRRMRHQLTSSIRTPLTGKAAETGNVAVFGELIDAEGRSLMMNGDFQITGDNGAQDVLLYIGLALARELKIEAHGRMEGGGGGGNVGFYVDRSNEKLYQEWKIRVARDYSKWVNSQSALRKAKIGATFIEPILSEGAFVVEKASGGVIGAMSEKIPATSPYYVGMSMGGTKLYAAIYKRGADGKPETLTKREVRWSNEFPAKTVRKTEKTPPGVEEVLPDEITDLMVKSIRGMLREEGLKATDLNNVGCTSPGPVDEKRGVIGAGMKTVNLPFEEYPFTEKIRRALRMPFTSLEHDGHSALKGEVALGILGDVSHGYYIIQGTGLGGSKSTDKKYDTSVPELSEPGHHFVRTPALERSNIGKHNVVYHYRMIRDNRAHPYEVVVKPDPAKKYQITEEDANHLMYEEGHKMDDFIWVTRGETDLEDVVAGCTLDKMLPDKERLVKLFGGEPSDYSAINGPADLSRLALTGSDKERETAKKIIIYIGEEVGKAMACLISSCSSNGWPLERIVIGSTIGEKLGIWDGRMLTTDEGEDFYYYHIRRAAYKDLCGHFYQPERYARLMSNEILRSPITQEERETAGFDRTETNAMDIALNDIRARAGALNALMGDLAVTQLDEGVIDRITEGLDTTMPDGHWFSQEGHEAVRNAFGTEAEDYVVQIAREEHMPFELIVALWKAAANSDKTILISLMQKIRERMEQKLVSPEAVLAAIEHIEKRCSSEAAPDIKGIRPETLLTQALNETEIEYAANIILNDKLMGIERMVPRAQETGNQIVETGTRYTLLVDNNLYKDGELNQDIRGYNLADGRHIGAGDRFNLEAINTSNVDNIMSHLEGKDPESTIIQISNSMSEADIRELNRRLQQKFADKAPAIRIMRVDTVSARDNAMSTEERRMYRFDLYATMLAARRITDKDIQERNSIYRTLEFFVMTHMDREDVAAKDVSEYITALVASDKNFIIRCALSFSPSKRWRVKEYHLVTAALICA